MADRGGTRDCDMGEVAPLVAYARGRQFTFAPPCKEVRASEIPAPASKLAPLSPGIERMLHALGFSAPGQPGVRVAGARYDPAAKAVYLASGHSKFERTVLLAHELTHALQDQYSLLPAALTSPRLDERLLALLLVEGDAVATSVTVAMTDGCGHFSGPDILWRLDQAKGDAPRDKVADAVLAELVYSAGAFVMCGRSVQERDEILSRCIGATSAIFRSAQGTLSKNDMCDGEAAELGALVLFSFLAPGSQAKDVWHAVAMVKERGITVPASGSEDSTCTWSWDSDSPEHVDEFLAILKKRLGLFPLSSKHSILRDGSRVTLRIDCPEV